MLGPVCSALLLLLLLLLRAPLGAPQVCHNNINHVMTGCWCNGRPPPPGSSGCDEECHAPYVQAVYVKAASGNDTHSGLDGCPSTLRTLGRALAVARASSRTRIFLDADKKGTPHVLGATLALTARDSGITIATETADLAAGRRAVLSGASGVRLENHGAANVTLADLLLHVPTVGAFTDGSDRYPGPAWVSPKVHYSPKCLHTNWFDGMRFKNGSMTTPNYDPPLNPGWHDMAGALTFKGTHHVFQGCPGPRTDGGWHHAASKDLVHWQDRGIGPKTINETYAGMESNTAPCSGFVTVNDEGVPCAGFRQCLSDQGTIEHNANAKTWDVPLEVRCALNSELTEWGPPQMLFDHYYFRPLPLDPVRPWKDSDGKWYVAISVDGCNKTLGDICQRKPSCCKQTCRPPCPSGGQLDLYTADKFNGPWEQLAPMFTTNATMRGAIKSYNAIVFEFVTSGYLGNLPGDPAGGKTRVVTQNSDGALFWVGQQSNGGTFTPIWEPGSSGFYDFGSLTMARTLGSDPNQVLKPGRKVIVGHIGHVVASMSLPRDLSLSPSYELLQQFVPELKTLRQSHVTVSGVGSETAPAKAASMQLEVAATFEFAAGTKPARFGVTVLVGPDGSGGVSIFVDCGAPNSGLPCTVGVTNVCIMGCGFSSASEQPDNIVAPLRLLPGATPGTQRVSVHAIVDHSIIEAIFSNRSAMAVYVPWAQLPSADHTGVRFFGDPSEVNGTLDYWTLDNA